MRWLLFIFQAFIFSGLISSLHSDELTELDFLADEPMVINSATRLDQQLRDIPAAVTVIDREMIEASSAINVIELMRLVPGFQVNSIDGTESTATYHGLSSQHNRRLQILIDGRSVYHSTFGGALWYSIPLTIDEIKKIEVIRGPNASTHGANAFSGVINIETYHSENKSQYPFSVLKGDRDTERLTLKHSGSFSDIDYRIVGQAEHNTGYQDTYLDVRNDGTSKPLFDDHSHQQISLRLDKQSENGSQHTFQIGSKRLTFGGGYFNNPALAPFDKKVTSHFQNYIFSKQNNPLKSHRFQIYHNYVDYNADLFSDPPVFTLDWSFRDQRVDLEYQMNELLSPTLNTVWGTGYRYETSESIGWLAEDKHKRESFRLFGHAEWKPFKSATINIGGLFEDHENIGDYFSPRVGFNYHINNQHTIRTSWSKAYRMPSFDAQFGDQAIFLTSPSVVAELQTLGDENLKPEELKSIEVGYLGKLFNNKVNLDLRIAKEKIDNFITRAKLNGIIRRTSPFYDPSTDYRFRYLNYGEIERDSIEIQLKIKPTRDLLINLTNSLTNAKGFTANDFDLSGNVINEETLEQNVPYRTTGALIAYTFPENLKVSLQYNYVDEHRTGGDGDVLKHAESTDLKIVKGFKTANGGRVEISGIVRNVADSPYQDFTRDNFVGLESYFQVKADLK